jgi:hypothetical protein
VLFLAAAYGFTKVIGLEFARDLDAIARKNTEIYERRLGRPSQIETTCIDATEYDILDVPVVLFFVSPSTGAVMKRVVDNISASFRSTRTPSDDASLLWPEWGELRVPELPELPLPRTHTSRRLDAAHYVPGVRLHCSLGPRPCLACEY